MRERGTRIAVAAVRRYLADGMVDRAPALAYYGVLSLFPLLLIGFSVLRLTSGADAPQDAAAFARDSGASGGIADALRSAVETARAASAEAAGGAGMAGLLALVYGASRAFTATGRALDVVAGDVSPRRSAQRRLEDIGWTLVVVAMVLVLLVIVVVSGRLLDAVLDLLGIEGQLEAWSVIRWPAALAIAVLTVAIVRYAAPTRRPRFRLAGPGALVTLAVLVLETAGYAFYVDNLASYNTTYGAFAGAIILMLWVWLAAIAFIFGAEVDAAIQDERAPQRTGAHPTAGHGRPSLPGCDAGATVAMRSQQPDLEEGARHVGHRDNTWLHRTRGGRGRGARGGS